MANCSSRASRILIIDDNAAIHTDFRKILRPMSNTHHDLEALFLGEAVADESPVVGYDTEVSNFFWLAGQGGFGIMMAPALAILTSEMINTGRPGLQSEDFAHALSPGRLL